jgi:hypothetical protein
MKTLILKRIDYEKQHNYSYDSYERQKCVSFKP